MRLDKRLQAFDDRRNALLDEMEALEPGTLLARPIPGKWSILEIVEHLVLAERVVFQGLPEPSQLKVREPRLKQRFLYLLVLFVLRADIPVGVISTAMLPQGGLDLAALRRRWDENQAWLRACAESLGPHGIHKAILKHPVAGPISVRQAVVMSRIHLERHIRQIRTRQKLLAPS